MNIKGTPEGYEDSVEAGDGGWAVWKPPTASMKTPCPNPDCAEPYNAEEPAHALECPSCGAAGCDHCFHGGRGCACPACEDEG